MSEDQIDYDAMATRIIDPETEVAPSGFVLSGDAARAYGREFLLREYGSIEAIERAMGRGRPRTGSSKKGPSPVVRGILPVEDFEALNVLVERSGKGRSELVRRAVHELLVAEKLVS